METAIMLQQDLQRFVHGSYLQGMETQLVRIYSCAAIPSGTDPTYKEWKPCKCFYVSVFEFPRTDPTYKEWKPGVDNVEEKLLEKLHGSYLQGMETRYPLLLQ